MPSRNRRVRRFGLIIGFLVVSLGVGTFVSVCSADWIRQKGEKRFQPSLDGKFLWGPINGFVQIPTGGQPGSTSVDRPTFEELDINFVSMGDIAGGLGWTDHALYGGARLIRLSGDSVLTRPLVSQGITFPAGSPVSSDIQLDWYRGGYRYRFAYANEEGDQISFAPAVGFALLNFDYELRGTTGAAQRGFTEGALQLGVEGDWSPKGPFSVSAGIMSTLPVSDWPLIFSIQATGGYQLWGEGDRGGRVVLGIGFDRIQFEDDQTIPNKIDANLGPLLLVGLEVSF